MKIELVTIQDVPTLPDLQRRAFNPLCEELDWKNAEGFKPYKSEEVGAGLTWVYMEKH